MTEWLKVPVLKTGVGTPYRGFESHSLRHIGPTRTLGRNSATEGLALYDSTTHDKLYLHSHTELLHILVSLYTINSNYIIQITIQCQHLNTLSNLTLQNAMKMKKRK